MTRKRPQPRGDVDALLGATAALARDVQPLTTLPVTALRPGLAQPRRAFDPAALEALASSIRAEGVLQPLLVRPVEGGHEIVAGERRWRAAQLAGLTEVPVVIRDLDDRAARAAALVENLQREDLGLLDEVDATMQLVGLALECSPEEARLRMLKATREPESPDIGVLEQVFTRLGRDAWGSFAKNKLRILNWPEEIVAAMRERGLPYSLAGVIAAAPPQHRAALLEAAQAGASLRGLRDRLGQLTGQRSASRLDERRVTRVGKALGSVKFLRGLSDAEQKEVDRWLTKMPEAVRKLVGGE